jgi:hypothetical protein
MGFCRLSGMVPEFTLSIFIVSRVGTLTRFKELDENRGCRNC